MRLLKMLCISVFLCPLFYSSPVPAAPDGADLLAACRHALSAGFDNTRGKMCQWYSLPCDCDYAQQPAPPAVCLPADVAAVTLAQQLVDGLQKRPALQAVKAGLAAARILVSHYPCPHSKP